MSEALFQPFPMLTGRRAQIWRHQPAYRRPRHFHAEPELNLVFRGWAKMGVGRKEVLMKQGDVLFLKPAQDHVMLDCSDDLDLFVVAATPELAARFSKGILTATTSTLKLPDEKLGALLEALHLLGNRNNPDAHESTTGDLFEWALSHTTPGSVVSRKLLTSLYGDADPPQAGALAQHLGLDPAELSRTFSSDLGVKFVEVRARLRLMRFIRSVDSGDSMTRAAAEHFGSYAQCHRVFRKYLGCAPSDFFCGRRSELAEATFYERKV